MTDFTPRPHQEDILTYSRGTMGISAVPGSGKTWTLSALAAKFITEGYLTEGQEILVVTLTNSAVDNFSSRINEFLQSGEYPPLIPPYRVRTLHGLAHDIVRERPDLVGLDPSFVIIDEREAEQIRNNIATSWLHTNPQGLDDYIYQALDENQLDWVRREPLPTLLKSITYAFNRTAKDMQLSPAKLRDQLDRLPIQSHLV